MNNNEPQVFGTQFQIDERGKITLYKVENYEYLEERRREYDLEPFEEYKRKIFNLESSY